MAIPLTFQLDRHALVPRTVKPLAADEGTRPFCLVEDPGGGRRGRGLSRQCAQRYAGVSGVVVQGGRLRACGSRRRPTPTCP